ncbi:hypothetical protein B0J13DRAFT_307482 [Dactylonectria estremocensis]|uniref:Uncharacterized protein n=1 Tax=Dactylonectria estremocensis TaxID=1079267 RepID=A0A9P9JAY6_9HYPO|nr:hypothetical protein B0J13DRAFT_307482 [Dactylonectria estremocensis]
MHRWGTPIRLRSELSGHASRTPVSATHGPLNWLGQRGRGFPFFEAPSLSFWALIQVGAGSACRCRATSMMPRINEPEPPGADLRCHFDGWRKRRSAMPCWFSRENRCQGNSWRGLEPRGTQHWIMLILSFHVGEIGRRFNDLHHHIRRSQRRCENKDEVGCSIPICFPKPAALRVCSRCLMLEVCDVSYLRKMRCLLSGEGRSDRASNDASTVSYEPLWMRCSHRL